MIIRSLNGKEITSLQLALRKDLFDMWEALHLIREDADGEERAAIDRNMWEIEVEIGRRAHG